jgi:hypothetical protein
VPTEPEYYDWPQTTVDNAVRVVVGALPGSVSEAVGLDAVGENLSAVRRWISDRHNWVRVGWAGVGLAAIVVGGTIMARKSIAAGAKVVTKAIPAGKVAKAL